MRKRAEAHPIVCHACSLQVLGRGGDLEGWKAVQMDPSQAELRWFCMKPICQHAYALALQEAQVTWAAAMPQPQLDQSELDQSSDQAASDQALLHQQIREHLRRQDEMALSMDEEDVPPEPKEPPPMLLAYETSNVEEAGYKDEEFPYYRFGKQKPGETEEPQEPTAPKPEPPKHERYVPTGSPRAEPKFVRHRGTGEKDE